METGLPLWVGGRSDSLSISSFMTFGSKLSLRNLLETAKGICGFCLIEGFHAEIKNIRTSISITPIQGSPQSEIRRIFIKSDDGSFAEFNSPLYMEEAASYASEKIECSPHGKS